MGGIISLIISVVAVLMFYNTGHPALFWLSVVVAVLVFCSWGLMRMQARTRNLMNVSNGITAINMIATFIGVALLICGIVLRS